MQCNKCLPNLVEVFSNAFLVWFFVRNILSTISKFIYCSCDTISMDKNDEKNEESQNSDKLKKDMLKPITKAKSELDEELKVLEVENSGGGKGGGGG
jgi:hypothetical protein